MDFEVTFSKPLAKWALIDNLIDQLLKRIIFFLIIPSDFASINMLS